MPRVVFGSRFADTAAQGPVNGAAAPTVEFVRSNTRLRPVQHVPEIMLHLADEYVPLWERTEEELQKIGLPPPFWAFAWAGGQALARYVLDNPALVAGRHVLDLASGSGLVAIAAAKAEAASVVASDIDPFAGCAIVLNAKANGVHIEVVLQDLLQPDSPVSSHFDLVLVADLFYERETAKRAVNFLACCRDAGACVLIGDPGRTYLPKDRLIQVCEYRIPVTRELEDQEIKRTAVWVPR